MEAETGTGGDANQTSARGAETDDTALETMDEEGEEQPGRNPASENLLDRLLYEGVLPRYAFPTDVATFHVFDLERSTSYRPSFLFTPSQGLGVALSQYAPGKDVWIGNKLWTSGAIYSPMRDDRYRAWVNRRLYYECRYCRYAETTTRAAGTPGEVKDCEACGSIGTFGPARQWLRPPGFAHPVYKEEGTSPDDQPARSYATRAKLTMYTPPNDYKWARLNSSIRIYPTRDHLLITNRGPREEGYRYCTKCGLIEPTALPQGLVGLAHKKPYPDPQNENCPGDRTTMGLVLGTDFISDILLISITANPPISVAPGLLATDVALRTVSEALAQAACRRLELEPRELQAEYRPALTAHGRAGREAEIYLYDTLPGGAGFSRQVGQLGLVVFQDALRILEQCPEGCDQSCYRCLRSYKNKFEHDLLDRYIGASLLRYVLYGTPPTLGKARIERSTDILFQDLERQGLDAVTLGRNISVPVPGLGSPVAPILLSKGDKEHFVVGLHNPLTPDHPSDPVLSELKEYTAIPVALVDELVVRRNLPSATTEVLKWLDLG